VWSPMRTRIGPATRASWASPAAATASVALVNATKNASPWVSTSIPVWRANASLSARRCSARSSAYFAPCSWRSLVAPSTSVKRNVTVPLGSSGRATIRARIAPRRPLARRARAPGRQGRHSCRSADVPAVGRFPDASRQPSVGLGEDVRLRGERAIGSGLEHDGEPIQLSAFTSRDGGRRAFGRIARPSSRR
jgi:hypothetical protein